MTKYEIEKLASRYIQDQKFVEPGTVIRLSHSQAVQVFIAGFEAGGGKYFPTEEESRLARIHWATQMLDHTFVPGEEKELQRKQVDVIGIVPWNTCYDWIKKTIRK